MLSVSTLLFLPPAAECGFAPTSTLVVLITLNKPVIAKRDEFIEKLYEKTGYKLLRVQGGGNIEDKIRTALDISEDIKPE